MKGVRGGYSVGHVHVNAPSDLQLLMVRPTSGDPAGSFDCSTKQVLYLRKHIFLDKRLGRLKLIYMYLHHQLYKLDIIKDCWG